MNINPMYPGFKVKNKDGSAMVDTLEIYYLMEELDTLAIQY